MTTAIVFRGTGDSQGVPRVYCDCPVCEEARIEGGVNRRYRSSLQIEDSDAGTTWIDCGPDWGRQMEEAKIRRIDRMLITHAHYDHIGGLPEWYDACRWSGERGTAYAPAEVIAEIQARFPWLAARIDWIPLDNALALPLGQWDITSWRVNHGKNGYSYAFKFVNRETAYSWVYCPDAIDLTEEQQMPLRAVDLLILGTSFYHEPYPRETRSLYDVKESLELFREWKPKRAVLTHLSHDIDVNKQDNLHSNVQYATTGMRIELI